MFWRGPYSNYIANVTDINNFSVIWQGNYSAEIYSRSTNYFDSYDASRDITAPVTMRAWTPNLDFGEPSYYKEGVFLEIGGTKQANEIFLLVDVFIDKSATPRTTLIYDMSKDAFQNGMSIAVPGKFKTISLRLRNSGYTNQGCEVSWMDFTYEVEGVRH